jgi:hypothetical protein
MRGQGADECCGCVPLHQEHVRQSVVLEELAHGLHDPRCQARQRLVLGHELQGDIDSVVPKAKSVQHLLRHFLVLSRGDEDAIEVVSLTPHFQDDRGKLDGFRARSHKHHDV